MQLAGSSAQSILQVNLSQESHPIGGVSANPLSRACEMNGAMHKSNILRYILFTLCHNSEIY